MKRAILVVVTLTAVGMAGFFVRQVGWRPFAPKAPAPKYPPVDRTDYDRRLAALAVGRSTPTIAAVQASSGVAVSTSAPAALWPAKGPYPEAGAVLPFNRVVAYYGNFRSTRMGILGEFAPDVVLSKLHAEVQRWAAADPGTPILPAIHLVAVTAQQEAGADGKHRLRMPERDLEQALRMGQSAGGIVFFDIQVGHSTVQAEVAALEKYWRLPQVHMGLDPEFAMRPDRKPGRYIGSLHAEDINWAITYLSDLVKKHQLPPKILVVHRFIQDMIVDAQRIVPTPQVQVVIDCDGWGTPAEKTKTYRKFVYEEPVQFAGFKLFYKNDTRKPGSRLMTPDEVLQLVPQPIYVQYQ